MMMQIIVKIMKPSSVFFLFCILFVCWTENVAAYPLDDVQKTGITRLEGYRLAQEGLVKGRKLPSGAFLPTEKITLRLQDHPNFQMPAVDAKLVLALKRMLGSNARNYGVALLDLSDLSQVRYAELNPNMNLTIGSVGKLMVGLGIFQVLADLYPKDIEARQALLRNTTVLADDFIRNDHHSVPFWKPGDKRVIKRRLRQGDRGSLWTFLDWMLSSSSNAAASMLIKNLVLMYHYGLEYPRPLAEMDHLLATTPKKTLSQWLVEALQGPLIRHGFDLERLRQGSFFTREGKRRIPGTSSRSTSRELMRFLVRMEQGLLVDTFSSLTFKRLLYMTDRRIRYASSPALRSSGVYFKSGSFYKCKPEPGFKCKKYQGNNVNIMNSVAMVQTIDRDPPLYYLVSIVSNVLYKNQAVAHQSLATNIHRLIGKIHPLTPGKKAKKSKAKRE